MSDAPIPRTFEVEGHKLTVPVCAEANEAYNRWSEKYTDEIVAVFAPFGLHPYEMPPAEFRRYVTIRDAEELESSIASERRDESERAAVVRMLKAAGINYITDSMVSAVRRLATAGVVEVPNV